MRVFYSTPSIYIQAINKMNVTYTVNNYDFFPYADVFFIILLFFKYSICNK